MFVVSNSLIRLCGCGGWRRKELVAAARVTSLTHLLPRTSTRSLEYVTRARSVEVCFVVVGIVEVISRPVAVDLVRCMHHTLMLQSAVEAPDSLLTVNCLIYVCAVCVCLSFY